MSTVSNWAMVSFLAGSVLVAGQDAPPPESQAPQDQGWRRVGDPLPPPRNESIPPQLTLKSGTFVTVRVDQYLSSDRSQAGDAFSATLVQPIVVDGVVVAQRGQTIGGRVAEAKKAGRVEGTSRLGVQLTDLTLVDGQVLPIQSQLINRNGSTSVGRDAGAIGTTTAVGAAVGAGAAGGVGAAIGAGAGAVASTVGVLLTRGHQTIIGPESVLTFRVEAPITISTDRAPQAFHYVEPNEYSRPANLQARAPRSYGPSYGPPPPPYYYGYGYGYPYYYGSGLGLYYSPGFYFRGGFHRGFRR